jgi:drug/metabolite transporter (DMT)-like permease
LQSRCLVLGRVFATKLRPRWRAVPERLRPPATTMAHVGSLLLVSCGCVGVFMQLAGTGAGGAEQITSTHPALMLLAAADGQPGGVLALQVPESGADGCPWP